MLTGRDAISTPVWYLISDIWIISFGTAGAMLSGSGFFVFCSGAFVQNKLKYIVITTKEPSVNVDDAMMRLALEEAFKASSLDEVPIGAVLLAPNGEIWAKAHNLTITNNDPTAHAEILALRRAAHVIGNYRLTGATLYTTIEPCVMCMGALIHARVGRVVFGAYDIKWGGCGSICNLANDDRLNHRIEITGGVFEPECRSVIQDFFVKKRAK